MDDPRLPPRDPTVVSEPMVRRMVRPASCIESLPNKGGQTAYLIEQQQQRCKCFDKKASA
ncbi:hypothetical protein A2U01_0062181 [Trifolium medium]|uniref:Uncharacterized protein n=1 Tax=Trifolium medium TaxID=97028 RepID=A0A392RWE3_9FABA|nr:hypothetical protein [Trifolium medium]